MSQNIEAHNFFKSKKVKYLKIAKRYGILNKPLVPLKSTKMAYYLNIDNLKFTPPPFKSFYIANLKNPFYDKVKWLEK